MIDGRLPGKRRDGIPTDCARSESYITGLRGPFVFGRSRLASCSAADEKTGDMRQSLMTLETDLRRVGWIASHAQRQIIQVLHVD
jgi:hypothetical protein